VTERPGDLDLLRAVYRRLDRAGLRADLPGLTDDDLLAFFRRLSHFLKPDPASARAPAPPSATAAVAAPPPPAGARLKAVLHADGGSRGNPGLSGFGVLLLDEQGGLLAEKGECIGRATSNEAEYHGLIAGLTLALERGVTDLDIRMDSDLVVHQINGDWKIRARHLMPLVREARALLDRFPAWRARHVPRELNARADELANQAMDRGVNE
jgi:ribonuclease HI